MAGPAAGKVQVGRTSKFSVLDPKGSKVKHVAVAPAAVDEGEQEVGRQASQLQSAAAATAFRAGEDGSFPMRSLSHRDMAVF